MGKNSNFDKIEFTPFSYRIGNLEVRNCYTDRKSGVKVPRNQNSHFNHYEIVKWEKNPYYGNEKDYILRGEYYQKKDSSEWSAKIHESCFESSETCYVIAYWVNMAHDELTPDLQFVGMRPFELETQTEILLFMELAKAGQYRIENELQNYKGDENDF
jgi:hypothetical protein